MPDEGSEIRKAGFRAGGQQVLGSLGSPSSIKLRSAGASKHPQGLGLEGEPADSSLERGAQGWKGSRPGAQAGRGPPSCYARRGQAARAMRPVMLRRSADTFLMGIL